MFRIVIGFFFVWIAVSFGISTWRDLTKRERWATSKVIAFGFCTAAMAAAMIAVFVVIF